MINRLVSFLVDLAIPVKDILKLDQGVQFKAILRGFNGEEKLVGPGKLELLTLIQETGSISQAAKRMDLSYKKAWDRINSLNQPIPPRWKKQPTLMPSYRGAYLKSLWIWLKIKK